MPRRRGRGSAVPTRRRTDPRDRYFEVSDSDRSYLDEKDYRLRTEAQRRWVIRIAVLAVLIFVAWMWGRTALDRLLSRGQTAQYELQKAGQGVRNATDERSGQGFDETP